MVPLESLDRETVKFIQEAQFCHYYLWRVVNKTDSLSTPVWLVVDPTMSSLGQRGEPTTFVMIRAWYGVTPMGNQAGYGLELLVQSTAEEFPLLWSSSPDTGTWTMCFLVPKT